RTASVGEDDLHTFLDTDCRKTRFDAPSRLEDLVVFRTLWRHLSAARQRVGNGMMVVAGATHVNSAVSGAITDRNAFGRIVWRASPEYQGRT
ncbi:MAG: hypothetical protein M3358_17055, partial [Actinomycetota bacterium]|nr:hypothetical protein [Actinomycetota bacterium]